MSMGSNETVNMTAKMMNDVLQAVEDYRGKTDALQSQLESTISELIPSGFEGAAANGFKAFYNKTFTDQDAIFDGLKKLLQAITDIANETLKAIPGAKGLDDQLGEGNNQ